MKAQFDVFLQLNRVFVTVISIALFKTKLQFLLLFVPGPALRLTSIGYYPLNMLGKPK
jgi:hypothetical protein